MTEIRAIALQALLCLLLAAGAYLWAAPLMGSISTYQSPFHGQKLTGGDALGAPLTRRVVFVYIDGLRVDTAADPQVMPFLNELRQRAAWTTSHSRQPSYTVPGYTTMLSGAWPEFNDGPLLNPDYEHTTPWPQDNLFAAVRRAGMKTALAESYFAEKLIPQETISDHFYTRNLDGGDRETTDAMLAWLKTDAHQFLLLHIDQVDHTGHTKGADSPDWATAARNADNLLREVASALDLTRDTIVITSDHGHIDAGGHGGDETVVITEPFVLAGAGVKPGQYPDGEMVDIAPTLAALLGTGLPALSQGRVRTDMLQLSAEDKATIEAMSAKQQAQWLATYNSATGQSITVPPSADAVGATQGAVRAARAEDAAGERLPRIALSVLLLAGIAIALWLTRRPNLVWLALGAATYLATFHVGYALILGRTYSLSSVLGPDDIVGVGVFTAAIAITVGITVALWKAGSFRQGAESAASVALGTALVTIAVVCVPALIGFAANGAVITWVLPDFPLMFLTFLTLLQIVGIGLLATVLAALASVIAWSTAR